MQKMRKMKDSGIEWIGEIPEGWELIKAKYLFSQRNEKGNSTLVLLSPTQKYGVIPQSQLEGVVQVKESTDLRAFKTIHIGDFVISLRSFQGGFEFSNYEGVCSPAYQVFHATKDLSNDFFRYLFKSDGFISKINSLTVGIREGKNIQYWDFSNMLLAVPPKEIQIRSAQYLNAKCSEIDTILSKTRSSIEEYKKLKQAVITQAVTKGVRGEREMKDSGVEWIGEISHDFSLIKLKHICTILDQYRKPISADKRSQNSTVLYDYYGASGVIDQIDGYTIDDHVMLIGEDGANLRMRNLPLMYEVCGKAWINNHAHILKPTERVNFYYLFYALEGLDINPYITGSAQPKLSQEKLQNIWIPLPSLEEQQEIATHIRSKCAEIAGLIAKKEQLINELENYKKSLIYEVVTGKREM